MLIAAPTALDISPPFTDTDTSLFEASHDIAIAVPVVTVAVASILPPFTVNAPLLTIVYFAGDPLEFLLPTSVWSRPPVLLSFTVNVPLFWMRYAWALALATASSTVCPFRSSTTFWLAAIVTPALPSIVSSPIIVIVVAVPSVGTAAMAASSDSYLFVVAPPSVTICATGTATT